MHDPYLEIKSLTCIIYKEHLHDKSCMKRFSLLSNVTFETLNQPQNVAVCKALNLALSVEQAQLRDRLLIINLKGMSLSRSLAAGSHVPLYHKYQ